MSLTAAQRRYLDKLDEFDVAEYLGLSDDLGAGTEARNTLADVVNAVRRHHRDEHAPGPIEWCAASPCVSIDWNKAPE